jgi:hypothetical protein
MPCFIFILFDTSKVILTEMVVNVNESTQYIITYYHMKVLNILSHAST